MSRNKTSSDSKANPRRSRYAGGRGLYHLWASGLSLFERCRSVRGTFCDIVAVDGHTTPDMAMHYQRLSKDRQRALADKVAASITPTQTDTAPASAENDKDKEIAELKKQIAQLKALASSQQESE